MSAERLVIRFSCGGLLRFLSHQERATAIERTLRRSMIPLAYTQGFHPRLKLSHSPAVPTGVASLANYVLLDSLERAADPLGKLNLKAAFTLRALGAWYVSEDFKRVEDFLDSYLYELFLPRSGYDPARFDPRAEIVKKTKSQRRIYSAGEVFENFSARTLRAYHVVKYSQPTDRTVPFQELLKHLSAEETASQEGVFVFVSDGYFKNRATKVILDEMGGI